MTNLIAENDKIKKKVVSLYGHAILVIGLVIACFIIYENVYNRNEIINLFISFLIVCFGSLLIYSVKGNEIKNTYSLGVFLILFLFFNIQSFFEVDPSFVGITRYFAYIGLFIIFPLYLSLSSTSTLFFLFVTVQSYRYYLVTNGKIDTIIGDSSVWWYTSIFNILTIFIFLSISIISNEYQVLIRSFNKTKEDLESKKDLIKQQDEDIKNSILDMCTIYDEHLYECDKLAKIARSKLKDPSYEVKEFLSDSKPILHALDQRVRGINDLSYKPLK